MARSSMPAKRCVRCRKSPRWATDAPPRRKQVILRNRTEWLATEIDAECQELAFLMVEAQHRGYRMIGWSWRRSESIVKTGTQGEATRVHPRYRAGQDTGSGLGSSHQGPSGGI